MNTIRQALVALALAAAVPVAGAAGWGALFRDGPAEDFNDEDVRLFMDAIGKTLDGPLDAPARAWRNDRTGAGGTVVLRGEPKVDGYGECRRVSATLYSRHQKGDPFGWTSCKAQGGRWVMVRMD